MTPTVTQALTLADMISRIAQRANTAKPGSLIQFTEATRITPLTNVDRTLLTVSELPDILQTLLSIYCGYYLLGIQLSVNSIDGVAIKGHLEQLATSRTNAKWNLGREDYTFRLPMGDEPLKPLVLPPVLATENDKTENAPRRDSVHAGRVKSEVVTQNTNLAVGKILDVTLCINDRQISVPVNARLNTFDISPQDLVDVITNVNPHQTAEQTKTLYQAGLISLWDAFSGKTAAEQWRKAALKDNTGQVYKETNRRSGNKVAALISGKTSLGDISNVYVMSQDTAREVEAAIGGKLSNFRVREKMMEDTAVMLLAVVDTDWKRVTIYHHSIDGSSSYGFGELKQSGKSSNHDIVAIMEALRQGTPNVKLF